MDSFVSHDGTRIAYLDKGSGPAVVLMHGLTANVEVNWTEPGIVDALIEAGYRVIGIDARGHANSDAPTDPDAYHPQAIADDVGALVKELEAEPVALVGYSYGCRTAAMLAAAKPIEVSAVILAGTDLDTTLNPHPKGNPAGQMVVAALLADEPGDVPGIKEMRERIAEWGADHKAMAHIYKGMENAEPIDFDAISAPTLVLNSPQEPDPSIVADVIPGAKTARLAAGDHLTGPKEPDFIPTVLGFLKEHVAV